MNLKKNILILPLLLLITAQSYGEDKNGAAFNCLANSPTLIAKSQLMQELEANCQNIFSQFSQQSELINNNQAQSKYKKRGTAFIRSLILPGAGERYLGKKTLAKTFLITEITLWVGYLAFRTYGKWVREDALAYAATHSGAITAGKPSQFFVDIGNYRDIDEYNDAKQRMWQFEKVYTGEDYYWQWDENLNRSKFENMRIASDQAINRSVFVLGGIFANHLLSAINAVWQTHRYNKKINKRSQNPISINIQTNYQTGEIALNFKKLF